MKKIVTFAFLILLGAQLDACKKESKQTEDAEKPSLAYQADEVGSSLQWTAYKTSDKVPVKGTFKDVRITRSMSSADKAGALDGMSFEIPVSSIFTNDTIRDGKLQKFFFAVMENSMTLKGELNVESSDTGKMNISMNGMSKELPFEFEIEQDTIHLNAAMDLNDWGAQKALESLNEACKVLHTGPDGVSKTWSEVALNAKIHLVEK
jgi:polyisoprenoid-binding protein YceI